MDKSQYCAFEGTYGFLNRKQTALFLVFPESKQKNSCFSRNGEDEREE